MCEHFGKKMNSDFMINKHIYDKLSEWFKNPYFTKGANSSILKYFPQHQNPQMEG